jgi:hypothetical protein
VGRGLPFILVANIMGYFTVSSKFMVYVYVTRKELSLTMACNE